MPDAHRALPGPIVDLIRGGVAQPDLRVAGDKAVWKALLRTASSAQQRGHSYAEWYDLLNQSASTLGRQARTRSSGKERTRQQYSKTLDGAWAAAERWLATAPPPLTRRDIEAQIETVRQWVADGDAPLDDAERAVLAAACVIAERNGTTRPALPRRQLVELTGLGERTVRSAIARLESCALLLLEVKGRAATDASRRRAGLYRLPDRAAMQTAYLYRGTRSMGPPAQVYGTPPDNSTGTPAQIYGTPPDDTEEEPAVVTVTISATDADQLAAAIAALQGNTSVRVDTPPVRRHLSVVKPDKAPRRPA